MSRLRKMDDPPGALSPPTVTSMGLGGSGGAGGTSLGDSGEAGGDTSGEAGGDTWGVAGGGAWAGAGSAEAAGADGGAAAGAGCAATSSGRSSRQKAHRIPHLWTVALTRAQRSTTVEKCVCASRPRAGSLACHEALLWRLQGRAGRYPRADDAEPDVDHVRRVDRAVAGAIARDIGRTVRLQARVRRRVQIEIAAPE
jgi:hypothetical protein